MNNYVLDLGFVAFENWWQFGAGAILTNMYLTANVVPAFIMLYAGLKNKDYWNVPLVFTLYLIPLIGSLFGMYMMKDLCGWDKLYLLQLYIFLTIVIGATVVCL